MACSKSSTTPHSINISSISPEEGPDSALVTITGSGFSTTPTDDIVSFNGKGATVISASSTQLVARVPTLCGTGPVTMYVNNLSAAGGTFTYDTTWRISPFASNIDSPSYISYGANTLYVAVGTASGGGGLNIQKYDLQGNKSWASGGFLPAGIFAESNGDYDFVMNEGQATIGILRSTTNSGMGVMTYDSGIARGITGDPAGKLYYANTSKQSIMEVPGQWQLQTFATGLPNVSGVAFGSDQKIYALTTTDTNNTSAGTIYQISSGGAKTPFVTGLNFCADQDIVIDKSNNLFVTSKNPGPSAGAIIKILPNGTKQTISTAIYSPLGIAMDDSGNLYVTSLFAAQGSSLGAVWKLTMH